MIYGNAVPFVRARKILPLLERMMDIMRPQGSKSDVVIDYRDAVGRKPELKEAVRQYTIQILRDKLINPEFAFIMRADMGLHHLLRELAVRVNLTEVWHGFGDPPPSTSRA